MGCVLGVLGKLVRVYADADPKPGKNNLVKCMIHVIICKIQNTELLHCS